MVIYCSCATTQPSHNTMILRVYAQTPKSKLENYIFMSHTHIEMKPNRCQRWKTGELVTGNSAFHLLAINYDIFVYFFDSNSFARNPQSTICFRFLIYQCVGVINRSFLRQSLCTM